MLPWSKAVCCIVVCIGQGDAGIACMEPAFIDSRATETRLNLPRRLLEFPLRPVSPLLTYPEPWVV